MEDNELLPLVIAGLKAVLDTSDAPLDSLGEIKEACEGMAEVLRYGWDTYYEHLGRLLNAVREARASGEHGEEGLRESGDPEPRESSDPELTLAESARSSL